ncbi:MAG TPA: 50S ribosomal protein L31 [Desulfatiglandales bacterium]|nr:50S ribosomal protein L31 [Desulfatiglandales bacterium]
MKKDIHPEHAEARVKGGCGNHFTTRSTLMKSNAEICSACHALYTSKQKYADGVGRIEKSQRKYSKDYGIKEKQGKY